MSKVQDPFTAHCLELLAPLGTVRARRMFGGVGLYLDELFIALIADERLYLKSGAAHRAEFEAAGCLPFTYAMKDGTFQSLGYFSAPDEALESAAEMRPWALLALDAALAAKAAKPPPKSRRTG